MPKITHDQIKKASVSFEGDEMPVSKALSMFANKKEWKKANINERKSAVVAIIRDRSYDLGMEMPPVKFHDVKTPILGIADEKCDGIFLSNRLFADKLFSRHLLAHTIAHEPRHSLQWGAILEKISTPDSQKFKEMGGVPFYPNKLLNFNHPMEIDARNSAEDYIKRKGLPYFPFHKVYTTIGQGIGLVARISPKYRRFVKNKASEAAQNVSKLSQRRDVSPAVLEKKPSIHRQVCSVPLSNLIQEQGRSLTIAKDIVTPQRFGE